MKHNREIYLVEAMPGAIDLQYVSSRYAYRVLGATEITSHYVVPAGVRYVKVEFSSDDLSDPCADPLIIGAYRPPTTKSVAHYDRWIALWDDSVWHVMASAGADIFDELLGSAKELSNLINRLENLGRKKTI